MSHLVLLEMMGIGLLVGLAKTSIGGLGLLCAALLTQILPAKESTGVLLILLIIGDLFAITAYRKYVDWKFLRTLFMPVFVGLVFGAIFLSQSTDESLKKFIGWVVVILVILYPLSQYWQKKNSDLNSRFPRFLRLTLGSTAGFMSMVANSGGTPMSIYLFLRRESVMNFLANSAWFFFIVNLIKLPFTIGLGILEVTSFKFILPAIPAIAVGALIGKKIVSQINQKIFQNLTLISAGLVGMKLILS
jgi:uncharacterized membrane protein YfcA